MMLYNLTKALNPLFASYWDMRFSGEGVQHIPEDGPLILAMNHVSYLDPWYLMNIFPRTIHFLVNKSWYERSPFWNWFFRSYVTFPVNDDPKDTISALNTVLAEGKVIGIFPEGVISQTGAIQRLKPGLAALASQSGAPVMPIGIHGARESLPLDRRWPRGGPIEMRLGKPFKFPGSPWGDRTPPRRTTVEFLNRTLKHMCQLSEQPVPEKSGFKNS